MRVCVRCPTSAVCAMQKASVATIWQHAAGEATSSQSAAVRRCPLPPCPWARSVPTSFATDIYMRHESALTNAGVDSEHATQGAQQERGTKGTAIRAGNRQAQGQASTDIAHAGSEGVETGAGAAVLLPQASLPPPPPHLPIRDPPTLPFVTHTSGHQEPREHSGHGPDERRSPEAI